MDIKDFLASNIPHISAIAGVIRQKLPQEGSFASRILEQVLAGIISGVMVGGLLVYVSLQVLEVKEEETRKMVSDNRIERNKQLDDINQRITKDEDIHRTDITNLRQEYLVAIKDSYCRLSGKC